MKKVFSVLLCSMPGLAMAQLADSAIRLVHMQGAINFRDAGGYTTKEGKQVVMNKVFRSADISKLTDPDMQLMAGKHIYTVIDLRGTKESAKAPDHLLPGTDYTLCPAGSDSLPSVEQMGALIKQGNFLQRMYGVQSIQYYGARYRPLFQKLLVLPDTAALLFHCTGGRDRTGMANALFLYALGVPQDKIEEDFTASNVYLKPMHDKMFMGTVKSTGMSEAQIKHEMELRPELIRTFFDALAAQYGSVDQFMALELGVGEQERALLKAKYTN